MHPCSLRVALRAVVKVLADVARFGFLTLHSRTQLAAENLFLRKQLTLYLERVWCGNSIGLYAICVDYASSV